MKKKLKMLAIVVALVIGMVPVSAYATSYRIFENISFRSYNSFSSVEGTSTQHSPYYSNYKAIHDSGGTSNGKHNASFTLNVNSTGYKTITNGDYYIWSKRTCKSGNLRVENDYARGIYLTISGGYSLIP